MAANAALSTLFPGGVTVADGAALHEQVPPQCWCVTRCDLAQLSRIVKQLVQDGLILPTQRDPFVTTDHVIGPHIHTLVQQLIKPVTAKAGKVSWALMLHPQGLECDIFVTHSWQEGIYEFVDKVLHSWPCGTCHAYCCMLSNPQNLDIGHLISSPRDSPFAHALRASSSMLVVPNMRCSIYLRVWCAYEAYLAYSESKAIFTASAPVRQVKRNVLVVAMHTLLALCVSAFASAGQQVSMWDNSGPTLVTILQGSAFVLMGCAGLLPARFSWVLIRSSAACSGAALGVQLRMICDLENPEVSGRRATATVDIFLTLGMAVCAIMGELGRLRRLELRRERRQLRNGYTGELKDAQSSVAEDKERIMKELVDSGLEKAVDGAIQVLLDAGMSTPTLREAAANAGARLKLAGYVNWPMVGMCLLVLVMLCARMMTTLMEVHLQVVQDGYCDNPVNAPPACTPLQQRSLTWLAVVGLLEAVLWVALLATRPEDQRGFASTAFIHIPMMCFVPLIIFGVPMGDVLLHGVVQFVLAPVAMLLGLAGPGRVSRIPFIGPVLIWDLMNQWPGALVRWVKAQRTVTVFSV